MPAKRTKKPRGRRPIDWTKAEGTLGYWQRRWETTKRLSGKSYAVGAQLIQEFVDWAGPRRSVKTIGTAEIAAYTRHLERKGRRVKSRLAAVKSLFRYVKLMDGCSFDPVVIPREIAPRDPRKDPTTWREAIRRMQSRRAQLRTALRIASATIAFMEEQKAAGKPYPGAEVVAAARAGTVPRRYKRHDSPLAAERRAAVVEGGADGSKRPAPMAGVAV